MACPRRRYVLMSLIPGVRAHTHYQAMRFVEEFRLFAAGSRFLVDGASWNMNPRKDPSCGNRPLAEFRDISLAEDGTTEIELDNRYRLEEPFDIEFGEHGFIVWSAASVRVAKKAGRGQVLPSTVLAPRHARPDFETISAGVLTPAPQHLPFEELSSWAVAALEEGAPIAGLLDFDQFPVIEHGWSAAPAHAAYSPARLIYW